MIINNNLNIKIEYDTTRNKYTISDEDNLKYQIQDILLCSDSDAEKIVVMLTGEILFSFENTKYEWNTMTRRVVDELNIVCQNDMNKKVVLDILGTLEQRNIHDSL